MKVKVNEDTCISCELCVQTCHDVFEMNDNGKAEVKNETVPIAMEALCQQAANECPVEAIIVS